MAPYPPRRAGFVEHTARDLLESNTAQVITQLTAARNNLGDDLPALGLDRAIGYLTAKQPYLHYRQAPAIGWPIATGVIEGACRHLVKTASPSPAPAGACPAPRPSCSCAP